MKSPCLFLAPSSLNWIFNLGLDVSACDPNTPCVYFQMCGCYFMPVEVIGFQIKREEKKIIDMEL